MKKTLSIILAILMIVTTIPMAFAAEDTPDFSDADELTSVYDSLYLNGEWFNYGILPEGKNKLSGNISTTLYNFETDGESKFVMNEIPKIKFDINLNSAKRSFCYSGLYNGDLCDEI